MTEETYRDFLDWRGIGTPCPRCRGAGSRSYSSTATWRGGAGGQMMTSGVCDACWGSGDAERSWLDLRKLERAVADASAEASLVWLAQATGAAMASLAPALLCVAEHIEALQRKRKLPEPLTGIEGTGVLFAVPRALREMVEARRRRDAK